MLNKKCNRLNDSIDDASEELSDRFDDKFNSLKSKVADLSENIDGLISKAEKLENSSIPITLDIPSKSRKPFVNLDDEDAEESEGNDGQNENNRDSSSILSDKSIGEIIDDEDSDDSTNEVYDNSGLNLATKADLQKLADYIKEQTERSRPTIPKEAGIAVGLVGVGIVLKKYAMILGGRNDVFR
ncbi:MAG TPA: hypothetical protein DG753_09330 [Clostridium sp.]|nr:hypothetical protein [Clostridium sp.]